MLFYLKQIISEWNKKFIINWNKFRCTTPSSVWNFVKVKNIINIATFLNNNINKNNE